MRFFPLRQQHRISLTLALLCVCGSLLFLTPWRVFAAESADEIVEKADERRGPSGSFSLIAKVVSEGSDDEQVEAVYKVSVKGDDRALIEQTAPARLAGRKLLMRDRDLWMYTPNMNQMARISFEQRLSGEVANGDLARTRFAHDYSGTLGSEETCGSKTCYKILLKSKAKGTTYAKIDYWVEKGSYQPHKAVFYALSGKALKTATYSNFKKIMDKPRMTKTVVVDMLNSKRKSTLTYSGHKKETFGDSLFSKDALGE